jgi:hypothetical protein
MKILGLLLSLGKLLKNICNIVVHFKAPTPQEVLKIDAYRAPKCTEQNKTDLNT